MFERVIAQTIQKITTETLNERAVIPLLDILQDARIPARLKPFFETEVHWWLYNEALARAANKRFDYEHPELASLLNYIDQVQFRHARFEREEFLAVLDSAVKLVYNYLCRPQTTLKWYIFRGQPVKPLNEVLLRFGAFVDYPYFPNVFSEWVERKRAERPTFDAISATEFERVVRRVDDQILLNCTVEGLLEMMDPLFEFIGEGDDQLVPIDALVIFFDDKNIKKLVDQLEAHRDRGLEVVGREGFVALLDELLSTSDDEEEADFSSVYQNDALDEVVRQHLQGSSRADDRYADSAQRFADDAPMTTPGEAAPLHHEPFVAEEFVAEPSAADEFIAGEFIAGEFVTEERVAEEQGGMVPEVGDEYDDGTIEPGPYGYVPAVPESSGADMYVPSHADEAPSAFAPEIGVPDGGPASYGQQGARVYADASDASDAPDASDSMGLGRGLRETLGGEPFVDTRHSMSGMSAAGEDAVSIAEPAVMWSDSSASAADEAIASTAIIEENVVEAAGDPYDGAPEQTAAWLDADVMLAAVADDELSDEREESASAADLDDDDLLVVDRELEAAGADGRADDQGALLDYDDREDELGGDAIDWDDDEEFAPSARVHVVAADRDDHDADADVEELLSDDDLFGGDDAHTEFEGKQFQSAFAMTAESREAINGAARSLEDVRRFIDSTLERKVLKKIFAKDRAAYDALLDRINAADTWLAAAQLLEAAFVRGAVDPQSRTAIRFTDSVYGRYISARH